MLSTSSPPSRPFGMPGRAVDRPRGAPARRVGWTSHRFLASTSGDGLPGAIAWHAAHSSAAPTGSAGAGRRCRRRRTPPRSRPGRAGAVSGAARTSASVSFSARWMRRQAAVRPDPERVPRHGARPYAALGERLGMSEDEVLERVTRLRGERIIRQISAIFDTRKLGYTSMLVAARTPPERADAAAEVINSPPRRDPQLPPRARVQHLVHGSACRRLAAGPRPHGRAAGRAGRGGRRSGRCRRCASSRSASTST